MNVTNLTKSVHNAIVDTSTNVGDLLILTKTLEKLQLGNISYVSTFTQLFTLTTAQADLAYVEADNKIYYRDEKYDQVSWRPIEKRRYELWSWGDNGNGSLSDFTVVDKSSPVRTRYFSDFTEISAFYYGGCGLRDGEIWSWGYNLSGQLGDGTTINRSAPVQLNSEITDWVSLAKQHCHGSHNGAIRSDGTIWMWGENGQGALGDGSIIDRSRPVRVATEYTDWIQLATGGNSTLNFTAALRANGTLWCWGNNDRGQLGNLSQLDRSIPVSVVGGFTDWTQVSPGYRFTVALRGNGTAWCWGDDSSTQLGQANEGFTASRSSPMQVFGSLSWVQVSAGTAHVIALSNTGRVYGWGENNAGQLGNNSVTDSDVPVQTFFEFTNYVEVKASGSTSLALTTNGQIYSWGYNAQGQCGVGNAQTIISVPTLAAGNLTSFVQLANNEASSYGLRAV